MTQRVGNRPHEWAVLAEQTHPLTMLGRWEEAMEVSEEFGEEQVGSGGVFLSLLQSAVDIHVQRGELAVPADSSRCSRRSRTRPTSRTSAGYLGARAHCERAEGKLADALADAERTFEVSRPLGVRHQSSKQGFRRGNRGCARPSATRARSKRCSPHDRGHRRRDRGRRFWMARRSAFRAQLDRDAAGIAPPRDLPQARVSFHLAVTLLEHAELTGDEAVARRGARDLRAPEGDALARAGRGRQPVSSG